MICPTCGSNLPDGARFCGKCGTDLSNFMNNMPGQDVPPWAKTQRQMPEMQYQATERLSPGERGQLYNQVPPYQGYNQAPPYQAYNQAPPNQAYNQAPPPPPMKVPEMPMPKKMPQQKTEKGWRGIYTAIIILGVLLCAATGFLIFVLFGDKDEADKDKKAASGNDTSENALVADASETTKLETEEPVQLTEATTEKQLTEATTEATTAKPTEAPTTEAATEAPYDPKEGGVHRYELVVDDVTWEKAYLAAKDKGGYLVRINSQEEMDAIINQIKNEKKEGKQFYIGGRRDAGSQNYYWVDESNKPYGDILNSPSYWGYSQWLENEPSFKDQDIEEDRMDILYVERVSRWTWNDVPSDILAVVPEFSGKIGYIIEYEN